MAYSSRNRQKLVSPNESILENAVTLNNSISEVYCALGLTNIQEQHTTCFRRQNVNGAKLDRLLDLELS